MTMSGGPTKKRSIQHNLIQTCLYLGILASTRYVVSEDYCLSYLKYDGLGEQRSKYRPM